MEQALDLREWLSALRRHRLVFAVLALVGLCGGVAFGLAEPAPFSSKAVILLPPSTSSPNGPQTQGIGTLVQIATSPGILERANLRLDPPLPLSVLQRRVKVTSPTSQLLQITATATTGRQSEQLANGVAVAFLAYITKEAAARPGVTQALNQDSSQIQRQISDLQQQIDNTTAAIASDGSGSPLGQSQLALLTTLEAQQQNAALQLDSVKAQLAQAKLSEAAADTGTVILTRATTAAAPRALRWVTLGGLGIVGGILIATVVVLLAIRRDHGLRRRDEIAEVVGAPVVASVTLRARRQASDWIDLFVRWQPGVQEAWTTRKVLRRESDGPMENDVTVIALAGDQAALVFAPQLAACAAAIGIPTTFVDHTTHESTLNLRRATGVLAAGLGPRRDNLRVRAVDDAPEPPSISLVVTAAVLEPTDPQWRPSSRSTTTWLAVSAGFATAEQLARVSVSAADHMHVIRGVVVVNADPGDSTTGRFPAPLGEPGTATPGRVWGTVKGRAPMSVEPSDFVSRLDPGSGSAGDHRPAQAEQTASGEFVGQFVSLKVLFAAVRRGPRVWLTLMAVGLVGGLAVSYSLPKSYSASTKLILEHSPTVDASDAMATDVALVQTQAVAQRVLADLHLGESAQSLLNQISARSLSNEVMEITVSAPTAAEATSRANAVAADFLRVRAQQYDRQNREVVAALNAEQASLSEAVNRLTTALDEAAGSTGAPSASASTSTNTLQTERTQDINQEAQIQQAVQSDNVNVTTAIASSAVLSPAVPNHHSSLKGLVTGGAAGLLAGGALGVGGVMVWAAVTDRVRRREDASVALGAPVELSLGRFRRPRLAGVARLRRRLEHPRPDTVALADHLADAMTANQSALAVVSVDSDEATALAVVCCARELIRNGSEVLVIDFTASGILSRLLGLPAQKTPTTPTGNGTGELRVYGPSADGWVESRAPTGWHVLVLATLDLTVGADHLRPWAHHAIAVITAGRSSVEKISTNAELIRAAGLSLDSSVLVGADPDDFSLGRRSAVVEPTADRRLRGVSAEPTPLSRQP